MQSKEEQKDFIQEKIDTETFHRDEASRQLENALTDNDEAELKVRFFRYVLSKFENNIRALRKEYNEML